MSTILENAPLFNRWRCLEGWGRYDASMIRTVGHTPTKAWHRFHIRRARWSWALAITLALGTGVLAVLGYFAQVTWPELLYALALTTYRLAVAYAIALAVGVGVALLVGWSRTVDFFFPIFDILQNLPSFALLPIFIYFFGFGNEMIILFSVTSIVWPILFAILTAIKSAHQDMSDAATIFGANGWRRVTSYLGPLSFPAILTGSIVGIAIGWEAVIGAEIIADSSGFGAFIKGAGASGISETTIAGIIAILLLVFVINRLVWAPLLAESTKHYAE